MKKILLLMMCCPVMLAAQSSNGVTVSNLVVNGGTVTFDVSWKNTGMPEVWSDSVWVFVDYNDNFVMKRLPVTSATATAGTVTKVPDNDQGVWIIGNARSAGSFRATVKLTSTIAAAGACAYASNCPPVAEYTDATHLAFKGTALYKMALRKIDGGNIYTAYSNGQYTMPRGYGLMSFVDKTGAPGLIRGKNQPQGGCAFTQPAALTTFANFPNNYSASTFVTLTDERDGNAYSVVKIGDRWIMAQNLNYQQGLHFNENAGEANGSAFTAAGSGAPAIGSFWCPGNGVTSPLTSCEVWGAMYTWETAMSFDGKGAWTESPATYNTGAANSAEATANYGRTSSGAGSGGRGICPLNWHVPTDNEWGVIFDVMEGGGDAHTAGATSNGWFGVNAGKRAKAACNGAATDAEAKWTDSDNRGSDDFGFRGLPAGGRSPDGSHFSSRGNYFWFWSSTAASSTLAWHRSLLYIHATVERYATNRAYGFPVRCIRDMPKNQPQGGCTFTQPPVAGTFADFKPETVGPSTFVTLTDERDDNNYAVVKIGGRWIMAQNLNYQQGLYFNENASEANGVEFTSTANGAPAIGSFWCPGNGTSAALTDCDYWGALYTWETAMSFDGKGAWTESPATYNTGAANSAAAMVNHGRTSSGAGRGGRGICPPNWHVPTDNEWGVLFDVMEGGGNAHQTAGVGVVGVNAGLRAKSKCGGIPSDTQVFWHDGGQGTDDYNFRALPASLREWGGLTIFGRGQYVHLWSSSANNEWEALMRSFDAELTAAYRANQGRTRGFPIRCIRD
jgi:uncharacterized protein (TIGR02145 family)